MDGIRYQVARGVKIGDGVEAHPLVFLVSDLADAKEVFRRRLVPASIRNYHHQQTLFYTHNNYNNNFYIKISQVPYLFGLYSSSHLQEHRLPLSPSSLLHTHNHNGSVILETMLWPRRLCSRSHYLLYHS